jgi:hypothetical protein
VDLTPIVPSLLQLGVTGIALLALGFYARSSIERERATTDLERQRADKAEARNVELQRQYVELNDSMRTEVVPVLIRQTDAMARLTEQIGMFLRDRRT